jgi:hypothetical protein
LQGVHDAGCILETYMRALSMITTRPLAGFMAYLVSRGFLVACLRTLAQLCNVPQQFCISYIKIQMYIHTHTHVYIYIYSWLQAGGWTWVQISSGSSGTVTRIVSQRPGGGSCAEFVVQNLDIMGIWKDMDDYWCNPSCKWMTMYMEDCKQ